MHHPSPLTPHPSPHNPHPHAHPPHPLPTPHSLLTDQVQGVGMLIAVVLVAVAACSAALFPAAAADTGVDNTALSQLTTAHNNWNTVTSYGISGEAATTTATAPPAHPNLGSRRPPPSPARCLGVRPLDLKPGWEGAWKVARSHFTRKRAHSITPNPHRPRPHPRTLTPIRRRHGRWQSPSSSPSLAPTCCTPGTTSASGLPRTPLQCARAPSWQRSSRASPSPNERG